MHDDRLAVADCLPTLYIVTPCYNEEDALPQTAPVFAAELESLMDRKLVSKQSRVLFVDDGSSDRTWSIVSELARRNEHFEGVKLSRNRGHQNALLCGLMEARLQCDAAISIDCDGQDDVGVMGEMVERFLDGDEVVYGVRSDRASDSMFKRTTAQGFYKFMAALGADTVYNHADYRLLSKRALDALSEFGEVNLFLRGIVPLLGFSHSTVTYERKERMAGESHYPLRKMAALALDGITSMSIKPVRIASALGGFFSLLGLAGITWALVALVRGSAVPGWTSTVVIVCLIGGIQLLGLGVIGEYVGKIYLESKSRPRYLVEARTRGGTDAIAHAEDERSNSRLRCPTSSF